MLYPIELWVLRKEGSAIYKSILGSASAIWPSSTAALFLHCLISAFVACRRNGHRVAGAVRVDGKLDVISCALFGRVRDELVRGVVLGIRADVFVELVHRLNGFRAFQRGHGSLLGSFGWSVVHYGNR